MPGKILIVDDNKDFCVLMTTYLKKRGYEVVIRNDPASGLTALRGTKPNLIILDVHMPKGGGQLLYDVVRKDALLKDLPIIVATAGAPTDDSPDLVRFAQHPKTLVLRKPLDLPRLETLLAKHAGGAAPPAP